MKASEETMDMPLPARDKSTREIKSVKSSALNRRIWLLFKFNIWKHDKTIIILSGTGEFGRLQKEYMKHQDIHWWTFFVQRPPKYLYATHPEVPHCVCVCRFLRSRLRSGLLLCCYYCYLQLFHIFYDLSFSMPPKRRMSSSGPPANHHVVIHLSLLYEMMAELWL